MLLCHLKIQAASPGSGLPHPFLICVAREALAEGKAEHQETVASVSPAVTCTQWARDPFKNPHATRGGGGGGGHSRPLGSHMGVLGSQLFPQPQSTPRCDIGGPAHSTQRVK